MTRAIIYVRGTACFTVQPSSSKQVLPFGFPACFVMFCCHLVSEKCWPIIVKIHFALLYSGPLQPVGNVKVIGTKFRIWLTEEGQKNAQRSCTFFGLFQKKAAPTKKKKTLPKMIKAGGIHHSLHDPSSQMLVAKIPLLFMVECFFFNFVLKCTESTRLPRGAVECEAELWWKLWAWNTPGPKKWNCAVPQHSWQFNRRICQNNISLKAN